GKTELLRQFSKNKKHLFFSSDLSSEQEQLKQFSEKIFQLTGESFLQTQPFGSWEALLRYIFDHLVSKMPLIIIDEFPYLCISNTALPSILQKIWDEKGKESNIFLILCGSYMSFMEKEVLGSKSPLFGRRTGQIALHPLSFEDLKLFFPRYSEEERTDVNIAIYLFKLAIQDKFDKAYIISGDSDLIPSIEAVKILFPHKQIGVTIPIGRRAELLKQKCEKLDNSCPYYSKIYNYSKY
ncbi:unnamed protein product, partial [marine sediment metagenome]